jgi:hypothetical protein
MHLRTIFVSSLLLGVASFSLGGEVSTPHHGGGETPIEHRGIELTTGDVASLRKIVAKDELPELKYESVSLTTVVDGHFYLLSARKPDYYGVDIVLSREGLRWRVLEQVKYIY